MKKSFPILPFALFTLAFILLLSPSCKKDKKEKPPPVTFEASFSASPNNGVMPFTAHFNDESIGDPDTWRWDMQYDGMMDDSIQNPSFTYLEPGFYSVQLAVSNATDKDTLLKQNYISVNSDVVNVTYSGLLQGNSGEMLSIPVRSGQPASLGAFSMKLIYDTYRLKVVGIVSLRLQGIQTNIDTLSGTVFMAWSSANPIDILDGEDLFSLTTLIKEKPDSTFKSLVVGDPTEFADGNAQVIENMELIFPLLNTP